jgi:NTE family protein
MPTNPTRALVLAGGGLTGIAWELGVLAGLADVGVELARADLIVGTSAGAAVGAQVTSGAPMADLVAAQRVPADQTKERMVELDLEALGEIFATSWDQSLPEAERLAKVGAMAKGAATISPADRRETIAARLPSHEWPATPLVLCAIDADTGAFCRFDAASGVSLVDAVAASCAVPGIWPPAPIGDSSYIDGGVRSATNADVASGCDTIVVLVPMPTDLNWQLDRIEVPALEEQGSTVAVLRSDDDALEAMGQNALDPTRRAPSLDAGLRQGAAAAADLVELWSGRP